MPAIPPFNVNQTIIDKLLKITPEFKSFIDSIIIRTGGVTGGIYGQLTDGASIVWDVDRLPNAAVTLGGNRTIPNPTGLVAGNLVRYSLIVVQDATGNRLITWGSAFKWPGGVAPVLSTAANAVDRLEFATDGTNIYLTSFGKDYR